MKIGLIHNSEICYNSLNYFSDNIEKALNDKGIETQRIGTFNEDVVMQRWDAIIAINSNLPAVKMDDNSFFADYLKCPVFVIFVDPPYHHHAILKEHMNNLHVIVLDKGHVEYCKEFYGPFQSVDMAYLLGAVGKRIAYEDKEIDILFSASVPEEEEIKKRALQIYGEEWADIIFELLIQAGINYPDHPMDQVLREILEKSNLEYSQEDFKLLMSSLGTQAEFYLRGYYRKKIVATLVDAGLRVHVAGNGWDKLYDECPENLVLEGVVDFEQMADLTANSKIVLNVMPWFKDGLHDRILTAMLNGSVCVTDSSSYIEAHFKDGEELVLYKLDDLDALPRKMDELLKDEEKAASIAENGKKKAEENYSWDRFVDDYILKYF